ncbi:hypothetical protein PRK78_004362 [Emydomyces testavorans]|uniref:Aminoglycoside phosphotransferase domain-containing protein n=1 Tax=Emydomyces testavorans TaxID=2070801 RepID=A0AAF0DIL0_9EURO|nr:hypothetical protein PRK78_004362 [Emydomyces testavorans]
MYERDEWPKMPDGNDYDGKDLLTLVRSGNSPFRGLWDVNVLIREVEERLSAHVMDIPGITKGSNSYTEAGGAQGVHLKLSNQQDVVARLARDDANMPDFDGCPVERQALEGEFEVAVYNLLRSEPNILVSRLLYYRVPVQHVGPRLDLPQDIAGRHLFLFERAEGHNNVWGDLNSEQRAYLLSRAAHIRASLFNFDLPLDFAAVWLRKRLFYPQPEELPIAVAPTREFCVALFTSKIEATIGNIGDMIGWEGDNLTVGPMAAAAKQSLLRLIPHIIPADSNQASLYRLVLEHGDFGIHNMSITIDANSQPLVTSLYDWEVGRIVPAILSDPLMAVWVDLVTDENAAPSYIRVPDDATSDDHVEYKTWTRQYFEVLFDKAPEYERVIREGKDARHIWFTLRDWREEDPEEYFGNLGAWAERRMKELGVH